MPTPRPWILLGSSLFIRPAGTDDERRIVAFLRRGQLLRIPGSFGADAAGADAPRTTLLALDPWGAPAAVVALDEHPGEARISLAVPEHEPQALREVLRLVAGAVPARMNVGRLALGPVSGGPEPGAALSGLGWAPDGEGCWSLPVEPGAGVSDAR